MNEVKLLPCVWCEGQTRLFQMKTTEGAIVEMVEHQGWPHCCVRRDSMTLAQWQSRPTTVVTDEVVERVARAICWAMAEEADDCSSRCFKAGKCMADDVGSCFIRDARAALASMPTVVTGEQQGWLPIESAPKDGTRILVWGPDFNTACSVEHNGFRGWCVHGWSLKPEPTHWQPLPEPPAQPGDA